MMAFPRPAGTKNIYNAQNQTVSEEAAEARGPRCFQGLIFWHPFSGRFGREIQCSNQACFRSRN